MRIILAATIILAGLAGCNRDGGNAQTNAGGTPAASTGGLPTPGPRPSTSTGGVTTGTGGDEATRQAFLRVNVESCIAAARMRSERERNSALGMDFRPYCTCAVQRLMEGRSVQELTNLQPSPRDQEAAQQCGREHGMIIDNGPGRQ